MAFKSSKISLTWFDVASIVMGQTGEWSPEAQPDQMDIDRAYESASFDKASRMGSLCLEKSLIE